jgi:DNA-binding CsgD family transcriptional regulator
MLLLSATACFFAQSMGRTKRHVLMDDVRDNGSPRLRSLETPLMKALMGVVQAAAKRLHPSVFQEMVRSVGVQLGRQAAAEYRLARHVSGRFDSRACTRCLEAIGKQFGWEFQAWVQSEGVIRIDVQGCPLARLGGPDPYLTELGYGLLGGVVADEFGYAKVCVIHRPEMPPFHCTIMIYLQESNESSAVTGIVFPQIVDEAAQLAKWQSHERPTERLTPRETEVFQLIARGLPDKEIAAALHLSVRTVQNHAAQVRRKLGIGSRTALVRFALRAPLAHP